VKLMGSLKFARLLRVPEFYGEGGAISEFTFAPGRGRARNVGRTPWVGFRSSAMTAECCQAITSAYALGISFTNSDGGNLHKAN
jgi:hypothetical protein